MLRATSRSMPGALLGLCRLSVFWYLGVLGGWALLGLAVMRMVSVSSLHDGPAFAMSAALLVALELLPLVQGRGHDPQGVVMSTAFVCVLLFMWGPWPAIVMISVAAIASDLRAGKPWWKLAFNVGQYSTTVAAAYLAIWVAGPRPSLGHPLPRFQISDLRWVIGAWVVYFAVNLILVKGVVARDHSFWTDLVDDFGHYTMMNFAVFGISPVIVVVAQNLWPLLPALLIPLLLLYVMAHMSLEKEREAAHDPLTGLPNRTSMNFALTEHLALHQRNGTSFGLLLIDLDHFKEVNDTLGHYVGDQLLIQLAQRLHHTVRAQDQVVRLGGDEFAVIIPDADEVQARTVAERIQQSLAEPVQIQTITLRIEASIGLAMYPTHGRDGEELLRHADVAMYTAKETRQGIALYAADRDQNSTDRLGLLGELRQALDEQVLQLHYQPKICLTDGSLLGVEALVRWPHPQRGFIPPDEFIPLAERTGIMPLLTERVIQLALGQIHTWTTAGLRVPIAVNISPTDLAGHRLTDMLAAGLRRHGIPADMLQLEITERLVAHQTAEFNAVLLDLHRMGIALSIDDFGTGYSSLGRLKNLPISELKIDRVFIAHLLDGPTDTAIVQAIIDLANAIGIPTIAEGVETEHQQRLLASMGCHGAQGWHLARPMPADQATQWIGGHLTTFPARHIPTPGNGSLKIVGTRSRTG